MDEIINESIAGAVGGTIGIVVGTPFDVIKVRMQAGLGSPSAVKTMVDIVKNEGAKTLYRGIVPPIVANIPLNAVFFASYGWAQRNLDERYPLSALPAHLYPKPSLEERQKLCMDLMKQVPGLNLDQLDRNTTYNYANMERQNWMNVFLSGCFAGVFGFLFWAPSELLKIKEQNYIGKSVPTPYEVARDVWRGNGLRGLGQGFWSTAWRDIPSCGVYFGVYEGTKHWLRTESWTPVVTPRAPTGSQNYALPFNVEYQYQVDYSTPATLAAGCVAGVVSTACTYPFDVIKTRIQTMPFDDYKRDGTIAKVTKQILKESGPRGLFTGLLATALPYAPVTAVTFYFYEKTMASLLKPKEEKLPAF